MRSWTAIGATVVTALFGVAIARSALQTPAVRSMEEKVLREYTGMYRWQPGAFVYLQMWNEFSGFTNPSQLVAFDESGDIRVLYPTDRDHHLPSCLQRLAAGRMGDRARESNQLRYFGSKGISTSA